MTLLAIASAVAGLLVAPFALYLGALAALARRPRSVRYGGAHTRFAVVVPAHDEEAGIGATVRSLLAADYPEELRRVVVVADNCSDATAARAAEAGATVWPRTHATLRGKGYALELAFERLLAEGSIDAVVVVDADTVVSANLLRAFDHRLRAGALACQAEYGVRNVEASWRTRLMAVALAMFHRTRSLARERLGLSCGLRGNGMCFAAALLREHPHRAYGLVEDVEYGIGIGRAGHRVWYVAEAEVLGEMVAGGKASVSQRRRWEAGRAQLLRQVLPGLLRDALRKRSAMLTDLALDLVVPPLATLGLVVTLGAGVEAGLFVVTGRMHPGAFLWGAALASLVLYGLRGIQHSGLGLRAVTALAWAPVYVAWKLIVARPRKRTDAWVRTEREPQAPER